MDLAACAVGRRRSPLSPIYIIVLCYNEAPIIRQTLAYYHTVLPTARIIVYDNYSTDSSKAIAEEMGAEVRSFGDPARKDNSANIHIKNAAWAAFAAPCWVFCLDMDEWIKIDAPQLLEEQRRGTSVIRTVGYQLVGDSACARLSDIRLDRLARGMQDPMMSKTVALHRPCIQRMRYAPGAHSCMPQGRVVPSHVAYPLYHYKYLGLAYLRQNHATNHQRTRQQRLQHPGWSNHYSVSEETTAARYDAVRNISEAMPSIHARRGHYPRARLPHQTASTAQGLQRLVAANVPAGVARALHPAHENANANETPSTKSRARD